MNWIDPNVDVAIKEIRMQVYVYAQTHGKRPEIIEVNTKLVNELTGSTIRFSDTRPMELFGIPTFENRDLKDDEIILGVKVKL